MKSVKKGKDIKTFEGACKYLKLDSKALPDFSMCLSIDWEPMLAHFKIVTIIRAINRAENGGKDWMPIASESKYTPYFKNNEHGFSSDDCDDWGSSSGVGLRLCLKSSELAEYAGTTFLKEYKSYNSFEVKVEEKKSDRVEYTIEEIEEKLGEKILLKGS